MMKKPHSLYLADQHLVFSDVDTANGLQTVLSLALDEDGYEEKFKDFLTRHEPGVIAIFVDLMSEEIKHEKIPHINGKDRKLLLDRKFKSLFPNAELTWKQHLKRETTGRKDDIYLLAGISLSVPIKKIIAVLIETQQKVTGIYSMPILQQRLNRVLPDHKQYLLVSRVLGSQQYTNTYRQAFYKNKNLVVCRVNSVSARTGGKEFDQLFDEIERTHQFLSGTNQLDQGEALSVISMLGEDDSARLFDHTANVNIELKYANLSELAKKLGIKRSFAYTNLPKLLCELAVTKNLKPHFRPADICAAYNTNRLKKHLTLASVGMVAASLVISAGLGFATQAQNERYNQLTADIAQIEQQKELLAGQIPDTEVPPKVMYQAVQLYQDITNRGHKPDHVFEIIARAYSGYQDLQLNQIVWVNETKPTAMDDGSNEVSGVFIDKIKAPAQFKIVISPDQSMSNRMILSRINDFSASLLQQPEITEVTKVISAIDTRTSGQLEESFGLKQQGVKLADFTLLVTM